MPSPKLSLVAGPVPTSGSLSSAVSSVSERTILPLLVAAIAALAFGACKTSAIAESDKVQVEAYAGLLPCADCAGIATTLTLKPDNTFTLSQRYLGKRGDPVVGEGRYVRADGEIELGFAEARTPRPTRYRLEGESLRQLDLQGKAVTGDLADRYLLQTFNPTLGPDKHHYWINAAKVDCQGVGPMNCMQVARGGEKGNSEWQNFYSDIEGFEFVPGQITHLVVRETKLDPATVPADASSIKYQLTRYINSYTMARPITGLHDIWALERLGGEAYTGRGGQEHPTLELNLTEMRAVGTDGCNRFMGGITKAGTEELSFGALAGTRKMCREAMATADAFNRALAATAAYRLGNGRLTLLDDGGAEVMVLRKVD